MPVLNEPETALKALAENALMKDILPFVHKLGATLYPVGGCVREAVSGKLPADGIPNDLDCLIISQDKSAPVAQTLAKQLATYFNGAFVPLDADFGIYRVVLHEGLRLGETILRRKVYIDLSDALENSLEADLARRDLSINAMALDLARNNLLDPFEGLSDLRQGIVRMVSEKNLLDDPLRILRVFRFAAMLGSTPGNDVCWDEPTLQVVKKHGDTINRVAFERVQEELYRLVSSRLAFPALLQMADTGFLEILIPEMRPMRDIPPNGHHHLGLFEHTLELVRQAERLWDELPEPEKTYFNEKFNNTSLTRFGLVKLACLFHDLGKPDTKAIKQTATGERFTYYGHDQVSANYTEQICNRLKSGNAVKSQLMHLTRWHLYPCQFGKNSSRKSVLRFYRRMQEATPEVILLALSDRHSTLGPDVTEEVVAREHENLLWLLENYRLETANLKQPPLLNGHDVMRALGMSPGPKLKKILSALEEAQQLGEIHDKEAALAWLSLNFSSQA